MINFFDGNRHGIWRLPQAHVPSLRNGGARSQYAKKLGFAQRP